MDRRERMNNWLVTLRAAMDDRQSGVWTAMPAIVNSYNATPVTCTAQPTTKGVVRQPNGDLLLTTMPLCLDCPVIFPGGGDFAFTFPLVEGDEGLLVFASRCIDAWWQQGGVQAPAELRMHDLSDGFFFPTGGLSQPKVMANVSATKPQLRNRAGTLVLELDPATNRCNILATGGLWINGVQVTVP